MDANGDATVTYGEWADFMREIPALAKPAPLPDYLAYSPYTCCTPYWRHRYGCWPYSSSCYPYSSLYYPRYSSLYSHRYYPYTYSSYCPSYSCYRPYYGSYLSSPYYTPLSYSYAAPTYTHTTYEPVATCTYTTYVPSPVRTIPADCSPYTSRFG